MAMTRRGFKKFLNRDELKLLVTIVGDMIVLRDANVRASKDKWPLRIEAKKLYCKLYNLI